MQTNALSLEESVRFQRGQPLPKPEELIALLNRLGEAQDAGRQNEAWSLEGIIRAIVKPGIYNGYLDDEGLKKYIVRAVSVERWGSGANTQTFQVRLEVLDEGMSVVGERTMELVEFLRPVNREGPFGGQHIGPRFWGL